MPRWDNVSQLCRELNNTLSEKEIRSRQRAMFLVGKHCIGIIFDQVHQISLAWPALWLAKAPASGWNSFLAVEVPRRFKRYDFLQFLLNQKIIDIKKDRLKVSDVAKFQKQKVLSGLHTANESWQIHVGKLKVGMCERHKNSRQTRFYLTPTVCKLVCRLFLYRSHTPTWVCQHEFANLSLPCEGRFREE